MLYTYLTIGDKKDCLRNISILTQNHEWFDFKNSLKCKNMEVFKIGKVVALLYFIVVRFN